MSTKRYSSGAAPAGTCGAARVSASNVVSMGVNYSPMEPPHVELFAQMMEFVSAQKPQHHQTPLTFERAVIEVRSRRAWLAWLLCWVIFSSAACGRRSTLPRALNDQKFWGLIETVSEPPGTFDVTENFVSNERRFAENARWLRPAGGVYIGVGPEQNFRYIARLRPEIAFITDIRRENRNLHLLYKALFELSGDRVEFVSRLFSRPRPAGLASTATIEEIFDRYDGVAASREQFSRTATLVRDRLLISHKSPLSQTDLEWINRAFEAFYSDGPEIQFWGARTVHGVRPSYRQLMTMEDFTGQRRSFLTTEDGFRFLRDLQAKNLIVPVVGDFGGPSAIHRVGDYVRAHADAVPRVLRVGRWHVPEQPTDEFVLQEPREVAGRVGFLVHRQRQRAIARIQAEGLPWPSTVTERALSVRRMHSSRRRCVKVSLWKASPAISATRPSRKRCRTGALDGGVVRSPF
jgi:hypothetical protein